VRTGGVALFALLVGVSVGLGCRAPRDVASAADESKRDAADACAAAVMLDDEVAAPVCRACRARGEVTP